MTTLPMTLLGKRVLVAEDDYLIAKSLVQDLRTMGVEVVGPAPSVAQALSLIEQCPLDGAVLDINLRGEMVFRVADVLEERGIPFVFASGYSADVVPKRHTGIARCEKPVDAGMLARTLFPTT